MDEKMTQLMADHAVCTRFTHHPGLWVGGDVCLMEKRNPISLYFVAMLMGLAYWRLQ